MGKKDTHVRWKCNILKTGKKYNTNAMPVSNLLFEPMYKKGFFFPEWNYFFIMVTIFNEKNTVDYQQSIA